MARNRLVQSGKRREKRLRRVPGAVAVMICRLGQVCNENRAHAEGDHTKS